MTTNPLQALRGKPQPPLFTPPLLKKAPSILGRFLGFHETEPKFHRVFVYISIFVGIFGAMLANLALAMHSKLYKNYFHFTTLPPSFAASCILLYGSISAPLAQPRNLIFGHFISGVIGVGITKLFLKTNDSYLWIGAALSCACSGIAMEFLGVVHPPAGASAVLPCLDQNVRDLGWEYLPVLLIHSLVFLGVALVVNNVFRKYPNYWVFPNQDNIRT